MKNKILNDMKVIIIILIGVTILFTILGSFNLFTKEQINTVNIINPLNTVETMENMDTPQCYSDTVEDYAAYNEDEDNDRYILKTKIVPPKGTVCPTEISDHASDYLDEVDQNLESTIINEETSNYSSTNNTNIINTNKNTPAPAESLTSTPEQVDQNQSPQQNGPPQQQSQNKEKSNDSCPPCPACERCPEPAFDCKKVPNYRSPSIGQYLPMPILNDFSTF